MRFWFIVPEHGNFEGLLNSIALRMRITFFFECRARSNETSPFCS
jgi:hypothetical protein